MNEKKNEQKIFKNDDLKNEDEPTTCTHSAPHSTVQYFFSLS